MEQAQAALDAPLASSLRAARVLIVDDDRVHGTHLAMLLEGWGAEPLVARTLAEATKALREGRPDLILLDVMMPYVDGYKMAQMFKRENELIPIIMLTALDDIDSKRRGMAAGADEFLIKPIDELELEIRLSSMLRMRRLAEKLEEANRKLADLASRDPLTQLANRRSVDELLDREFQRTRRYGNVLACFMIDVDHFKKVNDEHGHQMGDQVLANVAQAIRATIRGVDTAGRYGGEEFIVLAPETEIAGARVLAERLRRMVANSRVAGDGTPRVTVSIGIATTELAIDSAAALVGRADEALYQAKREGRDRAVAAR